MNKKGNILIVIYTVHCLDSCSCAYTASIDCGMSQCDARHCARVERRARQIAGMKRKIFGVHVNDLHAVVVAND